MISNLGLHFISLHLSFPLLKKKAGIIFEVNLPEIHPQFIVLIIGAREPRA
jgi:hypothetical protein